MNKFVSIMAGLLILSMFAGVSVSSASENTVVAKEVIAPPLQPMSAGDVQSDNFTKIEIIPRYGNLRLQAGESKEITVTVKNKEKKAVSVKPNIVMAPYGEYMIEKEWMAVTPDSAEIPAGGSQKFTVKATIPKDASRGYYNTQIAFTDEIIPVPFPQPYPNYIHVFQLSIDVWAKPNIKIMTSYISDQLEAGKDYDYELKLTNVGDKPIGINPKLTNDMIYGGPGMNVQALTEEAITITAPPAILAGATAIIKVHVKVPPDAKGYFNGYIDLGIEDQSTNDWENRINLNFNIYKQPTEPFVKSFSLKEVEPITIEISSSYYGYGYGYGYPFGKGTNAKEPSFETTLEGPGGKAELKVTKTVIKGNVNMGGEMPPWDIESTAIYQDMGVQHIETYKTDGKPGEWRLKVLPRNTQGFEYAITIGE